MIAMCVAGNYHSLCGEVEEAERLFTLAIGVQEDFAYGHVLLGFELLRQEAWRSASERFQRALDFDPRLYAAIAGLGEVERRRGKFPLAITYFEAAQALKPENPALATGLAMSLEELDDEEARTRALNIYDQILEVDSKNHNVRHRRAHLEMLRTNYEKAFPDLEFLRIHCPEDALVHLNLARCHEKLRRKSEAIFNYQRAADLDENWADVARISVQELAV